MSCPEPSPQSRLTALIPVIAGSALMSPRPIKRALPNRSESPVRIAEDHETARQGFQSIPEAEGITPRLAHAGWDTINPIIDSWNVPREGV